MVTILKRFFQLLALTMFWSACASAAITLVQNAAGNSGSTSASTQTIAFASSPAQNNLLVAGAGNTSAGTVSSCSDTLANTWAVVQTITQGTNVNSGICWAIQTHTAGADTVTCNDTTAGVQMFCAIAEYSSTTGWGTTPTDGGSTGSGTATSVATGSFSTTGTDVIFAELNNAASQTTTAGTGYTLLNHAPTASFRGVDEDQLNAAAGSYQGTFTNTAVAAWAVSAQAFKPAAAAGGCGLSIALMGVGCR